MGRRLHFSVFLISVTAVLTKEPELPLCPTNYQYLPQTLPMHCRMPTPSQQGQPAPFPSPYFPSPSPGKPPENSQVVPVPPIPSFGKPPGFAPGSPPGFALGALPGAVPGFPPGVAMPPGMPMAMPMPMPGASPSAKLPVIVMPFYSPDPSFKGPAPNPRPGPPVQRPPRRPRRKPRHYRHRESSDTSTDDNDSTDTDDSRESSGSDRGWWRDRKNRRSMGRPKKKKHIKKKDDMLTPILQYVTKDGYVIYEKKISKGEAKDWLGKPKPENVEESTKAEPEGNNDKSDEDEEDETNVGTTQAPQEIPKVQVKVQKNTHIKRHHRHKSSQPTDTKQH